MSKPSSSPDIDIAGYEQAEEEVLVQLSQIRKQKLIPEKLWEKIDFFSPQDQLAKVEQHLREKGLRWEWDERTREGWAVESEGVPPQTITYSYSGPDDAEEKYRARVQRRVMKLLPRYSDMTHNAGPGKKLSKKFMEFPRESYIDDGSTSDLVAKLDTKRVRRLEEWLLRALGEDPLDKEKGGDRNGYVVDE